MKSERTKLKEKLDKTVKDIIKERDGRTCQKCGKADLEGSNCHASHVIPVSAGSKLRWDPKNLKVLCYHDHINWWHKNPTESGEWFKKKFPKRWKYLQDNKGIKQFKIFELKELLEELKNYEHTK